MWTFPVHIASYIFHGHHNVQAHLDDIFWVHSGNVSFNLGGEVINIFYAIVSIKLKYNSKVK